VEQPRRRQRRLAGRVDVDGVAVHGAHADLRRVVLVALLVRPLQNDRVQRRAIDRKRGEQRLDGRPPRAVEHQAVLRGRVPQRVRDALARARDVHAAFCAASSPVIFRLMS
jgi:hypothetical protein